MRRKYFPVAILACVLLLNIKESFGQQNDSSHYNIKAQHLPIQIDSVFKPFVKQQISNITSPVKTLNNISLKEDISQRLNNQFKFPVNFKSPIVIWNNTNISSSIYNTMISAENGTNSAFSSTELSTSVSLWNVPFSLSYSSNSGWRNATDQLAFATGRFDKEKFLDGIKEKIKKTSNLEELFHQSLNSLYSKRDQAINTIKNDLSGILKNDGSLFKNIESRINAENISRQGLDQFLSNIMNENVSRLTERQNLLLKLKNQPISEAISDSISQLSEEVIQMNKVKEQIENQVSGVREKWYKTGVLEIVNGFQKDKQLMINNLIKDPKEITKIAEQTLSLSSLQRILLSAKSLNIGTSGINQGSLGLSNALLNGFNFEFLKGQRYFAPILGSQPALKNIADFSYSNFQELPNILTAALRIGKGDLQKDFSHISLSLFEQSNNQKFLTGNFQAQLPKNFVATFSKKVSFGESHSLLTEISKSTILYNQNSQGDNSAIKNIFSSNDFLSNMGLNLNYAGEFEKLGITNNLTIKYTGKEYANLGNFSLVSGTKEISNDIKKYFLKSKLIASLRAHYREYDFSVTDRKWRSFSYTADIKWKMKKGEFIEARYQPYFNRRINGSDNYLSSRSSRIALRGNINRKIAKGLTYRNFVELAALKDNFYDFVLDKFNSNSVLSLTSIQTLAVGKQNLFLNFTGNHAKQNTNYLFGNSSYSLDGGMTFNLQKNISMSSALVYNEVSRMYSQLSIRQSISAILGKRLIIEGFINAGKNLYVQDYLKIPAVNGNLSISYNLN